MKKKSYAYFYEIEQLAYNLRGNLFAIETEHRNFFWIEKSDGPIIVLSRLFRQSFFVTISHVS